MVKYLILRQHIKKMDILFKRVSIFLITSKVRFVKRILLRRRNLAFYFQLLVQRQHLITVHITVIIRF
jgi:hypothetical protein